ncbi:MAG: hypothetical protein JNK41_11780, partial [Saprospiraceae bacterium]|nr:hypothetical protein [Saprospiraceae bacterium]
SVSGSARKFPKTECNITISFNCTPGNEQNLIDATMQVLNKAKAIGAEDADLIKVKETQRQERIKSLEQNNFWNSSLVYCFENDINAEMVLMQNYEKLINSLSAEDLKQACNQYIDENSMIKITSNPEPEVIKP